MGAHRNVFEHNVILDNGLSKEGKVSDESVVIRGVHQDLQFRSNTIGYTRAHPNSRAAFSTNRDATGLRLEDNQLRNLTEEVAQK